MNINKYPINKEYLPLSLYTPNMTRRGIERANRLYRMPKSLFKDPEINISMLKIPGYKDGEIELILIEPAGIGKPAPCFYHIHGGGFVFEATSAHYRRAATFAKDAECIVAFVIYRQGPDFVFPYPQEDCFAALVWLHEHAAEIGIDPDRIGIGGDSAGGTLAVTSCLMARDRETGIKPLFQLLIYPFLDARSNSESYKKYTDTPVWNSTLSKQVNPIIDPHPEEIPLAYRSPVEADSLEGLPQAYIEVAEFDALRDDGILYSKLLQEAGIDVEFHDTHGTMHGYDYILKAPTTQLMQVLRIEYMKRKFGNEGSAC
ncbi:MAG: alpha/beta hydrolase [Mogibacterium sp.]|nr:alpha/beta hydrolase [Mogibacterium sp.]